MNFKIQLFALVREHIGKNELLVQVALLKQYTVQDLVTASSELNSYLEKYGAQNLLCSVNLKVCQLDRKVEPADEIAFFSPLTGG